jgi:hypothetical protein
VPSRRVIQWAAVSELVKGTEVSLDTLGRLADSAQIKKVGPNDRLRFIKIPPFLNFYCCNASSS